MEKKCRNCKFWVVSPVKAWDGKVVDTAGFGGCSCPKAIKTYRMLGVSELRALPKDALVVEYDEEWGMLAGPDFYCIHYESSGKKL